MKQRLFLIEASKAEKVTLRIERCPALFPKYQQVLINIKVKMSGIRFDLFEHNKVMEGEEYAYNLKISITLLWLTEVEIKLIHDLRQDDNSVAKACIIKLVVHQDNRWCIHPWFFQHSTNFLKILTNKLNSVHPCAVQ